MADASSPIETHRDSPDCGCAICRTARPFEMPEELVSAVSDGHAVLFAGAGISTESPLVAPYTLFVDLAGRMDMDPGVHSFPAVMTAYSDRHGRSGLLQAIRDRLEYVKSFPELQHTATAFHRELSTVHFIQDIVTTNWDTSFEDACGALPIVVPDDYAFWNAPGRKVFKIHGSITNWGTVVATEADYLKCYRRLRDGVVGASLKHLLATKSVIFVGYSLGDSDFGRIYGFLQKEMGEVLPRSYIVTLDNRITTQTHPGSVVLHTSGEHFVAQLKQHLMQTGCLLDDRVFGAVLVKHREVFAEHLKLSEIPVREHPVVLYCHAYQDGLLHAFERTLERACTGEYSHPCTIPRIVAAYESIRRRKLRAKRYWDVAYIDGYTNGLTFLLVDEGDRDKVPIYYAFGAGDLYTLDEYLAAEEGAAELHKAAYRAAVRITTSAGEGVVFHHTPWLL